MFMTMNEVVTQDTSCDTSLGKELTAVVFLLQKKMIITYVHCRYKNLYGDLRFLARSSVAQGTPESSTLLSEGQSEKAYK